MNNLMVMKRMLHIGRCLAVAGIFGLLPQTAIGQTADAEFSVLTLNVDGLPTYIGNIHVNSDGPGGETRTVSNFLARKGYDIIGVQEDFNYDEELRSALETDYNCGDWQGEINLSPGTVLGVLFGNRFETDGLRLFWRKKHYLEREEAVSWYDSYGKFDHCWDAIIVKGFHRCEMTLSGGQRIVVYNMHMDASTDADEMSGNDQGDKEARWSQWRQLRDYVMENLDERPVVLMGDMNSLYPRDSIKALFIDPINATQQYHVSDTWVEACQQGIYPEVGSGDRYVAYENGEVLDKILYINPLKGPRLELKSYRLETDYTYEDGTPMGDHFPVSVTFSIADDASGIRYLEASSSSQQVWTLDGRSQPKLRKGLNIVRLSDGTVRKVFVPAISGNGF